MQFNLTLAFIMLSTSIACYGQNSAPKNTTSPTALGETVSDLGTSIFVVFQAKNNDYWFGSDGNGVFRYDGKTATHFTAKDGLSTSRIREIQEDKAGRIYFSTQEEGVFQFDGKKFNKLPVVKGSEWKLEPDDLWFKGETSKNGPYRYDGKTLFSLEFPKHHLADAYFASGPNRSWSPYEVYKIYKDKKGNIWLGTSNFGICRYDGKSLRWMFEQHLTEVVGGGWFGIRSIIEDKDGAMWFCNTKYRYQIAPGDPVEPTAEEKSKNLLRYKREAGIANLKSAEGKDMVYFMSTLEDKKGDMWMATYGEGVYRFDGKGVTHYPVMAGDQLITLFAIYQDNQGDLWLGTHEHGALKFNGKTFEKYRLK